MVRSRIRNGLLFLVAVWVLLATPTFARADSDTARAKQLYAQGVTSYNLGHYDEALTAFEMGYRLRQDSAFLFNIAQCQRMLNRYQDAERTYRAYLRESSSLPDAKREQIQKLISDMERAQEEERAKQPPTGTQAPGVTQPTEAHPTTPPSSSQSPMEVHTAPATPSRRWYTSKPGWALSASGIVVLGVSVGLLGAAVSEHNAALSAMTQASFDDHHANTVRFQQAGWPLLGIGGALVVAGVTVFALHSKGR